MNWWPVLLGAVCILVGITGTVIPVLPGLLLTWAGVLVWAILTGSATAWVFFGIATAVYAAGIALELLVPGKKMRAAGVTWTTQAVGLIGAVIGAFTIPVVGFFVGFPLAVFLLELSKVRDPARAWPLTVEAIKGMGLNMLVELCTACLIGGVFVLGVVMTAP